MNKTKTILIYGLIAGLIMNSAWWIFNVLFMDMENYDMTLGQAIGYATMVLAFGVGVFFGVKKHRDSLPTDDFSFGQAFLTGLYISLVGCVIYVIGWMIYSDLMMPDFMVDYMAAQVQAMKESGSSAAEIETFKSDMQEWVELYKNPLIKAGITFTEPLPVGLIVPLIAAFVLKKK